MVLFFIMDPTYGSSLRLGTSNVVMEEAFESMALYIYY